MLRIAARLVARPVLHRSCSSDAAAVSVRPHTRGMNLLELLSTLPNQGVGAKVFRESWVSKG